MSNHDNSFSSLYLNNDDDAVSSQGLYSPAVDDNTMSAGNLYQEEEDWNNDTANAFFEPDTDSIRNRLSRAKASKLKAMSNINSGASLDDSFTDMGDGWLESNKNKIWNDISDQGIQSLKSHIMNNVVLTTDDQGNVFDKKGKQYTGRTRRLYLGGSKNPNDEVIKLGVARGDKSSSAARYTPDGKGYGWESGKYGIDVNNLESDVLVPYNTAVMYEAVNHGRKKALEGRVVKDMFANPYDRDLYGSGASEYYKSKEALFGSPTDVDTGLGATLYKEYLAKVPEGYGSRSVSPTLAVMMGQDLDPGTGNEALNAMLAETAEISEDNKSTLSNFLDRSSNTLAGFTSSFVSSLIVNPVDAIGDLTGLYDLGTEEEKSTYVNDFFGYDGTKAAEASHKVGELWDKASDPSLPNADRMKFIGLGMLEAFTTPEMLGTSLGTVLSWATPGTLLKAAGKGANLASKYARVDKLVDAGKLSETAGRVKKAKAFMSADGAKDFLVSQSGQISAALGNVNNQYEQFVANNNGAGLSALDKTSFFAARFTVQVVNQNLDKFMTLKILRGPGAVKALIPAVKAMSEREFGNFALTLGKGLLHTAANAGMESGQEYAQTSMELWNSRFGSEQFKDLDTFTKFMSDPRQIREAAVGAIMGAGGSGQFEVAGGFLPVTAAAISGSKGLIDSKRKGTPVPPVSEAVITQEEVNIAKVRYSNLLKKVMKGTNKVEESTIGGLLDDIDELNATKHVIGDQGKENQATFEKAYNQTVDSLVKFVKANPHLKLENRIGKKTTVKQSKQALADKEAIDSTPEPIKAAFTNLASIMGNGESVPFDKAVKSVVAKFKAGDHDSIVGEGSLDLRLQELEEVLTGNVSDNIKGTYYALNKKLDNTDHTSFAPKKDKEVNTPKVVFKEVKEETVLGSTPSSQDTSTMQPEVQAEEEFENQVYDGYSRAVDTERMFHTILGSSKGKEYKNDKELESAMKSFAIANGVNIKSVYHTYKDVKTHASVEDEAVRGSRGVLPRLARVKRLVDSSDYSEKDYTKEITGISTMHAALTNSITNLERGIAKAKAVATSMNKGKLRIAGKLKKVPTEYKKADGKLHTIYVRKEGNKWVADVAFENTILKDKQGYSKAIDRGLTEIALRDVDNKTGLASTIGKFTVPNKAGKYHTTQKKDANYIKKEAAVAKEINPDSKGITRIILGDKTSAKWSARGDYRKNNSLIINKKEIDENDVVLLNSTSLKDGPDSLKYVPDFGKAAQAAINVAVKAGATIVLDKSLFTDKDTRVAGAITTYFTKRKGYTLLEGEGRAILVKKSTNNEQVIADRAEKMKEEDTTKKIKLANKAKLVSLKRSIVLKVDSKTGKALEGDSELMVFSQYDILFDTIVKEDFKGDKSKLNSFIERQSFADVEKAAIKILNTKDADAGIDEFNDKAFEAAVKEYLTEQDSKNDKNSGLLKSLRDLLAGDPTKKEREEGFRDIIASVNAVPKNLIENILGERSFAKGKKDLYEKVYQNAVSGLEIVVPIRRPMTDEEVTAAKLKNNEGMHTLFSKGGNIFLEYRRVVQDATKLVEVSRTTVLNSISAENLPFAVREGVKAFTDAANKHLADVSLEEQAEQTDLRINNRFRQESYNLHNALSRGIIFDKDGSPNPEVMAAMYLAIGGLVNNDKAKMSRGFKDENALAAMFGVDVNSITDEMKVIAPEHGSLLKTAANSVAKDIATQLGITKVKNDETSNSEYEVLLADLGNATIFIAEGLGVLGSTTISSNDLAKMYPAGVQRDSESVTRYIHIADKKGKNGRYDSYTHTEKAKEFAEIYKNVEEEFPEAATNRKEPSFSKPSIEKINKALDEVRNDLYGKQVPASGKEALVTSMSTAYDVDDDALERMDDFLAAIDDTDNNVMKHLGWVEMEPGNAEYEVFEKMYWKDKDVQKSINDGIEKSIEEIRKFRVRIDEAKKTDKNADVSKIYFDYFYTGNDRFMMDPNTINPQTDKVHRFLFVPSGHKTTYNVTKAAGGGVLFSVGTTDQNLLVRMAIAQAFGQDVDKIPTISGIIAFGNAMLSMSPDQVATAKKDLLRDGKFVVMSGDKKYEGNSTHITHALQAIDFLEKAQEALFELSDGTMTSSLSSEFDSLTNGFFNKVLQMPILGNMEEHYPRVGILTEAQIELLGNVFIDPADPTGDLVGFDPAMGHSMNDLIATDAFSDSYENLAVDVVDALIGGESQKGLSISRNGKGRSGINLYNAIMPALPGAEDIGAGNLRAKVVSSIRKLFKNPFMIFNYSAGISRIVKNLSADVANDVGRALAEADFSANTDESNLLKKVAEDLLLATGTLTVKKDDTVVKVTTAIGLQEALRYHKLAHIKLEKGLQINTSSDEKNKTMAYSLEQVIGGVIGLTYGVEVENVFKKNFGEFIEVQDSMNDTFKVSFRIFNTKRKKLLQEKLKGKKNKVLTTKDHKDALTELWQDFPWIVGPLTSTDQKTGLAIGRDVIGVVDSSTTSQSGVDNSRKSPQTVLKGKPRTRTVSALVKHLEEAMSSGSVLPFHALDGSEISYLLEKMDQGDDASIAIIHDAIIASVTDSDKAAFTYQQGAIERNKNYSLGKALGQLVTRVEKTILSDGFAENKTFKDISTVGLKVVQDKDNKDMTFAQAAIRVTENLKVKVAKIEEGRQKLYGVKDADGKVLSKGILAEAYIANMASTAGGVLGPDSNGKPNTSHKEALRQHYESSSEVTIESTIEETTITSMVPTDISEMKVLLEEMKKIAKAMGIKTEEAQTPNKEKIEAEMDDVSLVLDILKIEGTGKKGHIPTKDEVAKTMKVVMQVIQNGNSDRKNYPKIAATLGWLNTEGRSFSDKRKARATNRIDRTDKKRITDKTEIAQHYLLQVVEELNEVATELAGKESPEAKLQKAALKVLRFIGSTVKKDDLKKRNNYEIFAETYGKIVTDDSEILKIIADPKVIKSEALSAEVLAEVVSNFKKRLAGVTSKPIKKGLSDAIANIETKLGAATVTNEGEIIITSDAVPKTSILGSDGKGAISLSEFSENLTKEIDEATKNCK